MDYKNIKLRILLSLLFFIIYFICFQNQQYLFFMGFLIYMIILYEVTKYFKIYKLLIIFYLIFSFLNFIFYLSYFFNFYIFNAFIIIIILFDTSSYFAGTLFGRIKILKNISPRKTLEGYIGGFVITNLFCLNFNFFYKYFDIIFTNFIFINSIIIFSIFGDLIQSFFKRSNYLKDSSNLLPGHGGFFDRFDSFISSIIILLIINIVFL